MNYFGTVSLFNGALALLTGLYVLFKNRHNLLYVSFATFAISIAFWAIFYSLWQAQDVKSSALFSMRLTMLACYYIPFAFLWFVSHLTETERVRRLFPFCWIVPIFFSLFAFSELNVKDVVARLYFRYWPEPGFLMHFFVLIFFTLVVFSFFLLFKNWFQSTGLRRWQLRWITITTLLAWGGGSTNWFLWYNIPVLPLPNFFVGIFFILIAYALIRRQLFDVDAIADYVHEAKLSALGILAASMFHEIRSPLFVARGYAESLLSEIQKTVPLASSNRSDSRSREKLEKVVAQIDRASAFTLRFLDLAKPSVSRKEFEDVPLGKMAENVLALVGYSLERDKISIQNQINPRALVYADRMDLEEILFNLVTNAYQAMKGGGTLRIVDERLNGHVRILVSDTGPGIPSHRIKRIFEPFVTHGKEKGTGLGLYIVRKLVERNRGSIKVISQVGKGTTFQIDLPASRVHAN